ncbi:MAG: DUF5685 family protein [Firmicutes bacterium]|nr:DUF5685 family protein [Bacillota bacterium]
MFGYVVIDKQNMLIKDFADYRAYYCGLCKALGSCHSQLTRLTVNYDITFLALVAHNMDKREPEIKKGRCVTKAIGRKFPIVQNNEILNKIADINVILGYYKAEDDILDKGSFIYKFIRAFLFFKLRRARKRLPEFEKKVKILYQDLRELEKNKETSLDKLSHPFASTLMEVGRVAVNETNENFSELCYNLGKWIYIIDAYDDLEKDYKDKKFNPLNPNGEELTSVLREKIKEVAEFNLNSAINIIRSCYDNMDITINEGALSNVVYLGLRFKTDSVLNNLGQSRQTACFRQGHTGEHNE